MTRSNTLMTDLNALLTEKGVAVEKDQLIEILHVINDTWLPT
jgi:hypothetical protein